jgi:hypothetical protein
MFTRNGKWTAWAGVLGSVLFVVGFLATSLLADDVWPYSYGLEDRIAAGGFLLSMPLLLAGVVGLYRRYAPATGPLGRVGLGITTLALLLVLVGAIGLVGEAMGWYGYDSWPIWVIGLFVLPIGMALFALAALLTGASPKAPALTTLVVGVAALLAFGIMASGIWPFAEGADDGSSQLISVAAMAAFILLFAGWAWLCYSTTSEEHGVAAKPELLAG